MRILTVLLIVAAFLAAAWGWFFAPYYIDAYKMNDVVGSAVLSWTAFNENRGRLELSEGLRKREIPDYMTPDKCSFYEEAGGVKVVDCAWTVDVYIPIVDQTRRLSFQTVKSAGVDGRLVE